MPSHNTYRLTWVSLTLGGVSLDVMMVERSDRMWSTGDGNGKPLQYSYFENPMNSMKRQKGVTLKDAHPRSLGVQYTTGEE